VEVDAWGLNGESRSLYDRRVNVLGNPPATDPRNAVMVSIVAAWKKWKP
jgi:hypothetical protein